MKTKTSRREFLKQTTRNLGMLGIGSTVFDSFFAALLQRAYADTVGINLNPTGYYVHMSLPGGPPRWCLDLLLAPSGITSDNFIQGGFGTVIDKTNSLLRPIYHVDKHVVGGQSIYLPPVWKMGVTRPFTELLPHTAFIRGMDMEINSHNLSNARQTGAIIGGVNLNGTVADGSQRPIPALVDTGSSSGTAFRSKKGYTSTPIVYGANPVQSILTPFQNYMAGRVVHNSGAEPLQEQALKEFEKYAQNSKLTNNALPKMYDNAMELIASNIYSLSERWASTVEKYRSLINTAMHPTKGDLPGIFDTAIASQNTPSFRYDELTGNLITLGDARDIIGSSTTLLKMAENFAISEILLDKVTSNMSLSFYPFQNLQSGTELFNFTHDQHFIGDTVSTLVTTLFYRCFLACLTEYVAALKAQGIFNRTVIHIAAEFNRSPLTSGQGSGHYPDGSNTTLISGMIQQPAVFGNIKKQGPNATFAGTFGTALPITLDAADPFRRPIQVNDVARTVTAMLGADDIVTNGRALLKPAGGVWVPRSSEAKNV